MKKIILCAIISISSVNLFSQTYKLETVFSDSENYLSNWKVIEGTPTFKSTQFSLWGYQQYYDDAIDGVYEVEYFKGDVDETYAFLMGIVEFTKKHKNEDNMLTYISDVKVKTMNKMGIKYTLVFDKEGKVACAYNENRWIKMFNKFKSYCEEQEIPLNFRK